MGEFIISCLGAVISIYLVNKFFKWISGSKDINIPPYDYGSSGKKLISQSSIVQLLQEVNCDHDIEKQSSAKNLWIANAVVELNSTQSINDLIAYKTISNIFYGDLLTCFEWRFIRLRILLRDGYKCKCGKVSFSNHVHHTYYIQNCLPWDIDEEALETLCEDCHRDIHKTNDIPIKFRTDSEGLVTISKYRFTCTRCGGHGYLPQFNHVLDGVCFKCWGHGPRNETFREVLQNIYLNRIVISDEKNRAEYKSFFNTITYEYLFKKVPRFDVDYKNRMMIDDGDDLPF